ncbi:MAG: hypothetical protein NDJ18_04105 [candidate division Zixibacteria bacterium]|nr:hypothetical protein [candidate division Zixibacteria bacterium]
MKQIYFILALFLILVLSLSLRVFDITADLPQYFLSKSQDLTTDGPYLTLYARNAIERGNWDPLGYEPWRQFKLSLISGVSYLLYSSFGVSRHISNLTGVLLSVVGCVLFLIPLSRYLSRKTVLLAAVLAAVSYPLVMFARVPFAENSLIFFGGLIFLIATRWFNHTWGLALIGFLVAMAGLLGKTTGFFLLAGPFGYLFLGDRSRWLFRAGILLGSTLVTSLLYSVVFLQGSSLFSFLYEHSAGVHGEPYGLTSPIGYLETLISFGRSRLHRIAPVESLLAYLMLAFLLIKPALRNKENDKATFFLVGWLAAWIIGLAPFNYLPMRYALPILLPMVGLAALWLESSTEKTRITKERPSWWRIAALLLLNWYGCFVLANGFISDSMVLDVVRSQIWYSLPVAALLTFLMLVVFRSRSRMLTEKVKAVVIPSAAVAAVLVQVLFSAQWIGTRTHTIDEAVRDMRAVVSDKASIGGPYGPAIAEGNGLQGFPLFVSSDLKATSELLGKYPVTHLAISYEEYQRLKGESATIAAAPVVARYWLRDNMVVVIRVAGLFGNLSRQYPMSAYERALAAFESGNATEGMVLLRSVVQQDPDAKSPAIELYHRSATAENIAALQPLVDNLVAKNETDFTVKLLGAVFYKHLARVSSNNSYLSIAQRLRDRAIDLSPTNRKMVENSFRDYDPSDRVLR